jgi:hypothetical protein
MSIDFSVEACLVFRVVFEFRTRAAPASHQGAPAGVTHMGSEGPENLEPKILACFNSKLMMS